MYAVRWSGSGNRVTGRSVEQKRGLVSYLRELIYGSPLACSLARTPSYTFDVPRTKEQIESLWDKIHLESRIFSPNIY